MQKIIKQKMKLNIIIILIAIICTSCGNTDTNNNSNTNSSSKYLKAQEQVKTHRQDMLKMFENSTPEVKRESQEFVNLVFHNTEEAFLQKSGKGKTYLRKVINSIDFFVSKIEDAKAFVPNQDQINLYNKFKGFLQSESKVVNQYINDNNPKFNHTDKQRIRMYSVILNSDFDAYRNSVIVTEAEFEKNFRFLVANWDQLSLEMHMHYGFESLKKQSGKSDLPF